MHPSTAALRTPVFRRVAFMSSRIGCLCHSDKLWQHNQRRTRQPSTTGDFCQPDRGRFITALTLSFTLPGGDTPVGRRLLKADAG